MAKLRPARRPKAIPSSVLGGDQLEGPDENPPAASTKARANKRPREDESRTPRPGKRARSALPDEEDDEAAEDTIVLDLFNDFAKLKRQPKKASGQIMVALRSSRGTRARTRSVSRAAPHEQPGLRTIQESPQPYKANAALLAAAEEQHDGESASEADGEAVEEVAHNGENGLSGREGYGPEEQDSAEELLVQRTPSRQGLNSPELHTATPEKMSAAAVSIWDFLDDDSPQKAPDKPVPRTQPKRKITATRTQGPKRMTKPRVPADAMLRAEDNDFAYPPTSAQPSRFQPSSSASRPPPRVAPRYVPTVQSSQATFRGGARVQRQAALEAVEEEGEIVRESVENSDDEVEAAYHSEGEQEEDEEDDIQSQQDESESEDVRVEIISTEALQKMHAAMGKAGWSNKGNDWYKRLRVHSGAGGVPGHTRQCERLFQYLFVLNTRLSSAPKAPLYDSQNKWFASNRAQMKGSLSQIGKMITKIREDYLAPLGDSDRRSNSNPDLRAATVADLTNYIVPILVHTLWIICTLGDTDKAPDGTAVLAGEVNLTETTLPYVRRVTNWISRLYESLAREIKRCPPLFSSQREVESAKKYQDKFAQQLYHLDENIQEAEDHLRKQDDQDDRLAEYAKEDQALRKRREKEEEDEEEKVRRRMEAVAQSTRLIASQTRPWERKWQRATAGWHVTEAMHTASSIDINGKQRPVAAVRFPEAPVVVMHQPWPDDDKRWLLDQLRSADRNWGPKNRPSADELGYWADVLERPVVEVAQEAELLRQSARKLCFERGFPLEEWMKI